MLGSFPTAGEGEGMKGIAVLAAGAALMSLVGCNGLGPNGSANAAAGNVAASAAKPADGAAVNQVAPQTADGGKLNASGGAIPASSTYAGTVRLDRTYMLGRWTDDGNCEKAIQFNQDGRFIAMDGGTGLWNLDGERLTLTGTSTLIFRISPVDQNSMTVVNSAGSLSRSTRC
jgi:hypothetical protein